MSGKRHSRQHRRQSGTGRESVWDYPRPPRLEQVGRKLRVDFGGKTVAETERGYRVLETSHPPTYYFPPADVRTEHLVPVEGRTMCEWKGQAVYFDLEVGGQRARRAVWTYQEPPAAYAEIAGFLCFYPSKMEACYVDGERVRAQEGDFYGGWITEDITGPFKGAAGTRFW